MEMAFMTGNLVNNQKKHIFLYIIKKDFDLKKK